MEKPTREQLQEILSGLNFDQPTQVGGVTVTRLEKQRWQIADMRVGIKKGARLLQRMIWPEQEIKLNGS